MQAIGSRRWAIAEGYGLDDCLLRKANTQRRHPGGKGACKCKCGAFLGIGEAGSGRGS